MPAALLTPGSWNLALFGPRKTNGLIPHLSREQGPGSLSQSCALSPYLAGLGPPARPGKPEGQAEGHHS